MAGEKIAAFVLFCLVLVGSSGGSVSSHLSPTESTPEQEVYRWATQGGTFTDTKRMFGCMVNADFSRVVDDDNAAHDLADTVLLRMFALANYSQPSSFKEDGWAWEVSEYNSSCVAVRCWLPNTFDAGFFRTWLERSKSFPCTFEGEVYLVAALPSTAQPIPVCGQDNCEEDGTANVNISVIIAVVLTVVGGVSLVVATLYSRHRRAAPDAIVKSQGLLPLHVAVIQVREGKEMDDASRPRLSD